MAKRYCGGSAALLGKYLAMRGGSARMRGEKDGRQPDDTTSPAPAPAAPAARRYPGDDMRAFDAAMACYQFRGRWPTVSEMMEYWLS